MIIFTSLILSLTLYAEPIKIAILDSGYDTKTLDFKQCDNGKLDRDFTSKGLNDNAGHGNNVLHIITNGLENVDYCIINIKIINKWADDNLLTYLQGLQYASSIEGLNVLNISLAGNGHNDIEVTLINYMLNKKVFITAAAGNQGLNLDKDCKVYPACYDNRIITVGCLKQNKKNRCELSNYGKYIKTWEVGQNVKAGGYILSGTSQATAKMTNNLIKLMWEKRKK